jgi:hypothetical protein
MQQLLTCPEAECTSDVDLDPAAAGSTTSLEAWTTFATSGELGLSEPFAIRDFHGSLSEYLDVLYRFYRIKAFAADIRLWGRPVTISGTKEADGRDSTFWHLITSSTAEHTPETRRFSLERCATLPRVFDVLEWLAAGDPRVCWWRAEGSIVMAAPLDFSQVVVLKESKSAGAFMLKTSYPILTARQARLAFTRAARAWAELPRNAFPATLAS